MLPVSLEIHPQTDARSVALPIGSADPRIEPVEFQGDVPLEPAIEPEVDPAQCAARDQV